MSTRGNVGYGWIVYMTHGACEGVPPLVGCGGGIIIYVLFLIIDICIYHAHEGDQSIAHPAVSVANCSLNFVLCE